MEVDYAWCAGLFDGEGTTSVLKAQRDRYAYVRMSVSQKQPEVLERFLAIIKLGKIYKSKTREIFSLDIYKQEDVVSVLNILWPYLSEVKKQQALNAFERMDTHNDYRRRI